MTALQVTGPLVPNLRLFQLPLQDFFVGSVLEDFSLSSPEDGLGSAVLETSFLMMSASALLKRESGSVTDSPLSLRLSSTFSLSILTNLASTLNLPVLSVQVRYSSV